MTAARPDSAAPRRRGRTLRTAAITTLALAAVCVSALAFVAHRRATAEPAWWGAVRATQLHPGADAAARDLEAFATTELTEPRDPDAPFELTIPQAHLNAWLATRLEQWATSQPGGAWPESVRAVACTIGEGAITLAADVTPSDAPSDAPRRIAWLRLVPGGPDALFELEAAGINALALPAGAWSVAVDAPLRAQLERVLGTRRFPIDGAREVVVLDVDVEPGAVTLTMRTRRAR